MKIIASFTLSGTPQSGLTPTITIVRKSDEAVVVNAASMTSRGSGIYLHYDYSFSAVDNEEYYFVCNAGTDTIDFRYIAGTISTVVYEIEDKIDSLTSDVAVIDGIVDSILASVISTTGSRLLTITVQDGDGVPISDAMVSIYLSGVLISRLRSNVSGACSTTIEDETYSVVTSKLGYSFTNPTSLIISDDYDMIIVGTAVTLVSPVPGSSCRVYEYLYDLSGVTPLSEDKVVGNATAYITPFDFNEDRLVEVEAVEGTYSESTGLIYWDIAQGATVSFRIPVVGISKTVLIPDESSARLYDLTLEEEES